MKKTSRLLPLIIWPSVALATILLLSILYVQATPQKTVIVGFDAPLSVRAAFDPSEQDAATLYLEENPDSLLKPQPFFYEFDPDQARGLFIEAKTQSIPFFITTQPSSLAVAGIDVFNDNVMLKINTSATSPLISAIDDYIVRTTPDVIAEQTAIAAYLTDARERRILVLQDSQNAAYTDPAWEVFSAQLQAADGWEITHKRFSFTEFSAADHDKVTDTPHEALYILAGDFQASIGLLVQLFHIQNPESPIYLTPWATSGAIIDRIGPAGEQVIVFTQHVSEADHAALQQLNERFIKRFGYQPNGMAHRITAALEMLEQAIRNGHTTPDAAKRYFLTQGPIETSLGTLNFDQYGDLTGAQFSARPLSAVNFE